MSGIYSGNSSPLNKAGIEYPVNGGTQFMNPISVNSPPLSNGASPHLNGDIHQQIPQRNDHHRRRHGKGEKPLYEPNQQHRRQHDIMNVNNHVQNNGSKYNNNNSGSGSGSRKGSRKGKGKGNNGGFGHSRGGGRGLPQANKDSTCREARMRPSEDDKLVEAPNFSLRGPAVNPRIEYHRSTHQHNQGTFTGRFPPASTEELVRRLKASRSKSERQRALAELGENPEHRKKLTAPAATVVVAAAGRDNGWRDALKWLELMKNDGSPIDVFHFSAGINACAKGRQWEEALQLLRDMSGHGVPPDEVCFNGAINACARAGRSDQALKLLEEMKEKGLVPNTVSYSAAISACAKGGEWERALPLLEEMRLAGHDPNVISYSAAMSACAKGGQWEKALGLLEEMRKLGLSVDVVCYNAAIGACGGAKDFERALSLLQQMRQENVAPNVVTFNAAINACEKAGGQWLNVLMLLDDMKRSSVRPDIISYNLAISACEQSNQGHRALGLLKELQRLGITPDASTFNTTVIAMTKTDQLQASLDLWKEMTSLQLEPSVESTTCLLQLCDRLSAYRASMEIFSELSNRSCRIQLDSTLHALVLGTCAKASEGGSGDVKLIEDFIQQFPTSKLVQPSSEYSDSKIKKQTESVDQAQSYVRSPVGAASSSQRHHGADPFARLSSSGDGKASSPGWQLNDGRSHIHTSPIRSHTGVNIIGGHGGGAEDPLKEFLGPHDWWASSFSTSLSSENDSMSLPSRQSQEHPVSAVPLFDSWTSPPLDEMAYGGFLNNNWPLNHSAVNATPCPPHSLFMDVAEATAVTSNTADEKDEDMPPLVLDKFFAHLGIDDDAGGKN